MTRTWTPKTWTSPEVSAGTIVGSGAPTRMVTAAPRPTLVVVIKAVHTLAWLSIESCVVYVLHAGWVGRTDRGVCLGSAVVAGESMVFAGNGFRCPLTELATRYGARRGSVTDIYLPSWFAHNIPAIHAPLLVVMAYLHVRNLRRRQGRGTSGATTAPPPVLCKDRGRCAP